MNSNTGRQAVVGLERTISASPHEVYRAWLDPDTARRWLAPGGLTVKHVQTPSERRDRRSAFIRMKAIKAFDPPNGPRSAAEGRARIEGALARFDQACRNRDAGARTVASTIFGAVSVADFAAFQMLHVRNHVRQMPTAT